LPSLSVTDVGDAVRVGVEARAGGGSSWGSSGRWWGCGSSTRSTESASSLALLSGGTGTGADTNGTEGGTAGRCAVGIAQALAGDELFAFAVTDVWDTVGVWVEARAGGRGSWGCSGRWWGCSSAARSTESASGLALLSGGTGTGADTNGTEGGTASRCAVGIAQALASNELFTLAVTNMGDTIGVGGKRRCSDDGSEDERSEDGVTHYES